MAKYVKKEFYCTVFIFPGGIKLFLIISNSISFGYSCRVPSIAGTWIDKLNLIYRYLPGNCKNSPPKIAKLYLIIVCLGTCLKRMLRTAYSAKIGRCSLNLDFNYFGGEYKSYFSGYSVLY